MFRKKKRTFLSDMVGVTREAPATWKRAVERAHWPEVNLPTDLRRPDFRMPKDVRVPDITLPRVHRGEIHRYDVQLPDVTIPRFRSGDVTAGPRRRRSRRVRTRRGGGFGRALRAVGLGLFATAVAREMSQPEQDRTWQGRVFGVPYNFQPPTSKRLKDAWWNADAKLFTPTPWGMGWTVNFRKLMDLGQRLLADRMRTADRGDDRDLNRNGATAASPTATAAAEEQRQREDVVNQASIDSFPASDSPAH